MDQALLYVSSYKRACFFLGSSAFVRFFIQMGAFLYWIKRFCMFLHTNGRVSLLDQALLYVSSYKRARFSIGSSAFVRFFIQTGAFLYWIKRFCTFLHTNGRVSLLDQALLYVSSYKRARFSIGSSAFVCFFIQMGAFLYWIKRFCIPINRLKAVRSSENRQNAQPFEYI
ncbi:hypothetical protein [Paenibacillus oryzae]|uniref:hypothetical protein n=1 Tax=Paenibacillus oryzae TaxID=1844972 RepID=UPI0012E9D34C|nr:hypothetical protein [Paenibacillus oryzae]